MNYVTDISDRRSTYENTSLMIVQRRMQLAKPKEIDHKDKMYTKTLRTKCV